MGRVEKRMYRRARGQAAMRRGLVIGTAAMIALGLVIRHGGRAALTAQHMMAPTATPVTAAYDETVETREITLPEDSWYAIQTGIYSTRAAADEKRDTYARRGAPGYVNQDGEKWRVYIACYGAKEDAAAVRERLRVNQEVETFLHTWVCPEMTLRLTGMVGQLDVVEAGLSWISSAAAALRDNAAQLDGGECTLQEAQAAVEAINSQVHMWRETAEGRFVKPYPELVAMEISLAESWDGKFAALCEAEGATAFSAQMKLQAMAIFDESCALRQRLME